MAKNCKYTQITGLINLHVQTLSKKMLMQFVVLGFKRTVAFPLWVTTTCNTAFYKPLVSEQGHLI